MLKGRRKVVFRQFRQIKRLRAGNHVGCDQPDQHHCAAHQRIERQFHRPVLAPRRSPNRNEEILRDDGQFVKDEEEKKIKAQKDSINAADQRQIKREKLPGAALDVPREQHPRDRRNACEQHQRDAHPVSRQMKMDVQVRNPRKIHQVHRRPGRGAPLVLNRPRQGAGQPRQGGEQSGVPGGAPALRGQQHQRRRAQE